MQKLRILNILKILQEESNENNRFTANMLIKKLDRLGIKSERKTIYSDIEALTRFGIDIINRNGYFIGSRQFENAELKIITDCINSSHFITEKKTRSLIKKVEGLTDIHSAKALHKQAYTTDFIKTSNEGIYYNVDILQTAIEKGKKVSFKYFSYNVDKTKNYRNGGNSYTVSPFALVSTNENYYLLAHHSKRLGLTHYRVDRMTDLAISRTASVDIEEIMGREFNLSDYTKKMFGMYSGELKGVKIKCDNSLINVVMDKFGEGVFLHPEGENHFVFSVNINVSPTFFGWVFTFGDGMEIVSPPEVKDEYYENLCKVMHKYK